MPTDSDHATGAGDLANRLMEAAYADPATAAWIRDKHRQTLSSRGIDDDIALIEREIAAATD